MLVRECVCASKQVDWLATKLAFYSYTNEEEEKHKSIITIDKCDVYSNVYFRPPSCASFSFFVRFVLGMENSSWPSPLAFQFHVVSSSAIHDVRMTFAIYLDIYI